MPSGDRPRAQAPPGLHFTTFPVLAALSWNELWQQALTAWRYPLFQLDNRPLTLGNIVGALLLFGLGLMLSRVFSKRLFRRLTERWDVTPAGASALEAVSFYLLVVMFFVLALQVANIPLAAFTFLGGAVAIGVGFGSQNIINNFISGLILLAERPVRVGDVIQFDSYSGTVMQIGARSTRLRTGLNQVVIVPNSTLLQTSVANSTLENDHVRSQIVVTVAYGTSPKSVSDLLIQTAREHSRVLPEPVPWVWLADFGDNGLRFELYFWIHLGDQRGVESEIRQLILSRFDDADIRLPSPQREVHMDLTSPLEVQLSGKES